MSMAAAAAAAGGRRVPTIFWMADLEYGDYAISGWEEQANSGTASSAASQVQEKYGSWSEAMTITASGSTSAVRLMLRTAANPDYRFPNEAYYSSWYWLPANFDTTAFFWQIQDFKTGYGLSGGGASSDPNYTYNVDWVNSTTYKLRIYDHCGNDGRYNTTGVGTRASSANFAAETWIHVETYYKWAIYDSGGNHGGRVTTWVDGVLAWDLTNEVTEYDWTLEATHEEPPWDNSRQWKINHYSDGLTPTTATMYVDQAIISSGRIYPHIAKSMRKFLPTDSADDASQSGSTVTLTGTSLTMGTNTIGLRFRTLTIPQGSKIHAAHVLFASSAANQSTATTVTFYGQAADDAAAFTTTTNDISSRTKTATSVSWTVPTWVYLNGRTTGERSPDIRGIIQEVVNRAGWASGNDLALIIEGSGSRQFASVDNTSDMQPELIVVWS